MLSSLSKWFVPHSVRINFITLVRQAVTPRASYMLAAEYVLAED